MNIVPTDSASIFAALNTLVTSQSRLALVRPNNPPPGIAGFLLDVVEDDGSDLESDITDHYIEDNTAIQDHIALRPEAVSITGKVAELVRAAPVLPKTTQVTDPLPLLPELQPVLSPGAEEQEQADQETEDQTEAADASPQSLFGYYQNNSRQQPGQTKQSFIYGYFYQLWKGRQLFSVETPWGIFENMAILSMSAKQGAESRSVTDFSITFKKIRVARAITIQPGLLAGRAVFQQAPETRNGVVGQVPFTSVQMQQFSYQTNPPRT